ncbi:hypothetical protein [Tenacibaculum amylolyticum]|uniref:hypothetical protein n=1 Tax=Tenacibaculum amylolyticum TaxID=104269 RepID=UPI0038959E87
MDQKEAKQDFGKVEKIAKTIKKAISKEFLWVLFSVIVSIPLAMICSYIISSDAHIINEQVSKDIEEVAGIITTEEHPLFRVIFGITMLGIYFSRMVATAIKTLLEDKK